jgi:cysteine desulfurase
VASAVEHSSVLIPSRYAAAHAPESARLIEVGVERDGRVDLAQWSDAVAAGGVAVAALQQANGEGGHDPTPSTRRMPRARVPGSPSWSTPRRVSGGVGAPAAYDALVGDAATVGGPPLGLLVTPARTRFARSGGAARG